MSDGYTRKNAVVLNVEYASTNKDGNPTFRIVTDEGLYKTVDGGAIGYGITNHTAPRFPDDYIIGAEVTLVLTKAGRVAHIERDGKHLV